MGKSIWTSEDVQILREKYPECGWNIPELLETHTKRGIVTRASQLGISESSSSWTEDEVEVLQEKYPVCGSIIPELLETHTRKAIRTKAALLGLSAPFLWTDERIELLREKYSEDGTNIPELLEVFSRRAIIHMASKLGLSYQRKSHPRCKFVPQCIWTEERIDLLCAKYPKYGPDIPELLEVCSRSAIMLKASRLGLSQSYNRWTDDEVKILRIKYPEQGYNIPELLEMHSETSIQYKAYELGLYCRDRWTKEDTAILKMRYDECGFDIPELIGKYTQAQIRRKATGLRLTEFSSRNKRNKAISAIRCAFNDYYFVKCSVCDRVFIVSIADAENFTHETEGVPLPDGWVLPYQVKRSFE